MIRLPHPIPYQGSKRKLAPLIGRYLPKSSKRFFEPFAGSAAMSIYAAYHRRADSFVIADSLEPMVQLLTAIVDSPEKTSSRYEEIWNGQTSQGPDYFNRVRDRYNADRDPVDLLYLICRCVKNAIRFNKNGNFTQSVDKRRLGMRPQKMGDAVREVSSILKGRVEFRVGDWIETTSDATPRDFVYMDPPYLGTTIGRDKRYHQQLELDELVSGLEVLIDRQIQFALSYDGMTGDKEYGPPLPDSLGLTRLLLHAGTSSQATLSGKKAQTIESLYVTRGLAQPTECVIKQSGDQLPLALEA